MVKLKEDEGDPHNDLEFWQWALKVIQRLGAEGMSSDESVDELNTPRGQDRLYRVRIMVWRKRVEEFLKAIDECRQAENGIFSLRGSMGLKRTRPPNDEPAAWPRSSRPPVECLPFVFYDERWFNEVDANVRMATLHVTAEEFRWAQIYSRN